MSTQIASHRPPIMGVTHVVSSGHYLASAAGYRMLEEGGNAVDAGVASGIVINVVQPQMTGFGGVAPIAIYMAESGKVVTISGLGRWPKAASIDFFEENHGGDLPWGILRTVTPAAADAWMTALEKYGTMTFEQVIGPAIELAEEGFPLSAHEASALGHRFENIEFIDLYRQWPSTTAVVMPEGRLTRGGERLVQKDLARTFRTLVEVERANAHKGREDAIRAARDHFYKGEMAEKMVAFCQEQGGFLTMEDMKDFTVRVEEPVAGRYKDYEIYTCGPWCQGPVVAQTLQMLEDDDLQAMGHNSPDYIHVVAETLNLSFSDREHYYGDPDFVDVPMDELMSKGYTKSRRELVNMERAFGKMPPKGDPRGGSATLATQPMEREPVPGGGAPDTSYTCVVDRWGNAFSATPSDSLMMTPIVPGLGLAISARGISNWMERDHPSSIGPWKRPRLTPNPAIALKKGKLFMPFGTPGGDIQCQAMVQTFLNIVEFGMNAQEAVDAPRFVSWNFPNSFWPHGYLPGRLVFDPDVSDEVVRSLIRRGHDDTPLDMSWGSGSVCAIEMDHERGMLIGGADHRRDAYAIGR